MDAPASAAQVNIGSIRVTGAAPTLDPVRLSAVLRSEFTRQLSEASWPTAAEIANLRVQLPHAASEAQLAAGVARAVAAALKDERP